MVTIGMGKKIPKPDHRNISDAKGVVLHGSVWHYVVRDFVEREVIKKAAEHLYHLHC